MSYKSPEIKDNYFQLTNEDIKKIQKTISDKFDERKQLLQKITQKIACRRVFQRSLTNPDDEVYFTFNKKNSKSGQQSKIDETGKIQRTLCVSQTIKQQMKQVVQVQSKIKDRNKRVFGGINSYLKSAQKKIQSEAGKNKQKSQIMNKIAEKERNQTKIQMQKKYDQIKEEIQQLHKKKDQNGEEMRKLENLILKTQYIQYANYLQNFIFTKTQPSIAWKCNNNIKKVSQTAPKSLKTVKSQSLEKIQKLKETVSTQILMYNTKFQYYKYMIQNQKQYLKNYLNRSHSHILNNFFMTKTEPQILWKPAIMSQQLQKVKLQSDAFILEKHVSNMEKVDQQIIEQQKLQDQNKINEEDMFDYDQEQYESPSHNQKRQYNVGFDENNSNLQHLIINENLQAQNDDLKKINQIDLKKNMGNDAQNKKDM